MKQMGLGTGGYDISPKSMEEIDIFETAESPTGERIKLFVDELESLEPCDDVPHSHSYKPPPWPQGNELEYFIDYNEGLE